MKKAIISLFLVWIMALNMTGCSKDVKAQNLMEGITPNEITVLEDLGEYNPIVAEFALNLFKACNEKGKNTLISPVSVLSALAMTYNGADGRTYEQMEKVFGLNRSIEGWKFVTTSQKKRGKQQKRDGEKPVMTRFLLNLLNRKATAMQMQCKRIANAMQ